jgi:hypothetical protein
MTRAMMTIAWVLAAGCTGQPGPGAVVGHGEDMVGLPGETPWCGATVAPIGSDEVAAGFDRTPGEAWAATTGPHTAPLGDGAVAMDLAVVGDTELVRARMYAHDEQAPAGVVLWDSSCADHYAASVTWSVDAGDLFQAQFDSELLYFQASDAMDATGSDTSFAYGTAESWQGTGAPSWDPAEPYQVRLNGHWAAGTWRGDVSFLAESTALTEREEILFDFDAVPVAE